MQINLPAHLKDLMNRKADEYNQRSFIATDPICVPHAFTKKQDIEIAAFFAAILAWGNRTTIIAKSKSLMQAMDNAPHDFCLHAGEMEFKRLLLFKHRTFNATDILYFVEFLKYHYTHSDSLETAFTQWMRPGDATTENALRGFYHYFFSLPDAPPRTRKHIATPDKKSTCKRLNMFLRWMVRADDRGVDFGIWNNISPSQLICPVDVHVARVAQRFNMVLRKQADWLTALELTACLRQFCADDPVKYDFALFGLGVVEKF
ncbi:TIGR02757 family protein [Agriterribacter sp.]|uniref:TIGR02757 family protein n=1 Tax=Agriterribacter sp. TaxID=2821509 RepID=UPI002CFF8190|nr:TIGR02757 family protein [Agriterribacter sp.]HRP56028.1 TIGR02757 family protein [Agriterribacter sp.]